ncbi:MAG: hypothetical protein ACLQGV_17830 [Bryobacteraceae bacterium]
MQEITQIEVLPAAKIGGLMGLLGSAVSEILRIFPVVAYRGRLDVQFGQYMLLMPILSGLIGFVSASVCCWVYNRVTPIMGGIEIELRTEEQPAAASPAEIPAS